MSLITVLGSSGFIGSNLVKRMQELKLDYYCPGRDVDIYTQELGKIVYCVGLTADFRSRPFDTVEAHVSKLAYILKNCRFDSLLYLSSTRVYNPDQAIANEADKLTVSPMAFSDLYNISKIMGESISIASEKKVTIARLSNVYGNDYLSDNFIHAIIHDAISKQKVTFQSDPASAKDYIGVNRVIDALLSILLKGKQNIYNVASGFNTSNLQIANKLQELTGCEVHFAKNATRVQYPQISIAKIKDEFNFTGTNLLDDLAELLELHHINRKEWEK